jgi:hypothetical protein
MASETADVKRALVAKLMKLSASWQQLSIPTINGSAWNSMFGASDGSVLYNAVFFGNIYKSVDGGDTWTPILSITYDGADFSSQAWVECCCSADGNTIYAASQANNAVSGYIWKSSDAGETWTPILALATLLGQQNWQQVICSSDGSKVVAAVGSVTTGDIYTSSDGGETWIDQTGAGTRTWCSIAMSGDGNYIAATCDPSGGGPDDDANVHISLDGGDTWSSNAGGDQTANFAPLCYSRDGTALYIGYGLGVSSIYKSSDHGQTWTNIVTGLTHGLNTIACSDDGGVIMAATGNTGGGPSDPVFLSTDGGTTFNAVAGLVGAGNGNWNSTLVSSDGSKLFISQYGGFIYYSDDTGETWIQSSAVSQQQQWLQVVCSSDGTKVAAITIGGGPPVLWTSSDGGDTWTNQPTTLNLNIIAMSGDGSLLVGTDSNYVYTSSDNGAHWTQTSAPNTGSWGAICCSDDGSIIVAASSPNLYVSEDSGDSWTNTNPSASGNYWSNVCCSSDGSIRVAADDSSGDIWTSIDGGAWTDTGFGVGGGAGDGYWGGLACSADGGVIAAAAGALADGSNGLIYLSTDKGTTWTPSGAPQIGWIDVVVSPDGKTLAAVDYSNSQYVWISTDAGTTWSQQTVSANGLGLAVANNEMFAALLGGYIYRYSGFSSQASFSKFSILDPALYRSEIEAALGQEIFNKWSDDPKIFQAQLSAALGSYPFTTATALSPELEMEVVAIAIDNE